MKRAKQFIITHVLILEGPPDYREETRPFEGKVYEADKLPAGFTIQPTRGDAFLGYKWDGTVRTACSRNFFMKRGKSWERWPFHDFISPEKALERDGV